MSNGADGLGYGLILFLIAYPIAFVGNVLPFGHAGMICAILVVSWIEAVVLNLLWTAIARARRR